MTAGSDSFDRGPKKVRAADYVTLRIPTGATYLFPANDPLRGAAMSFYVPLTAKGRLAKLLLRQGLWRQRGSVDVPSFLEDLESDLADLLGVASVACAVRFGTAGLYAKTAALAIDRDGEALACAKLADAPAARDALIHEARILGRLAGEALLDKRIPAVLFDGVWQGYRLLVTTVSDCAAAPSHFCALHRDFLDRLRFGTARRSLFANTSMWRGMCDRRETLCPEGRRRFLDLESRLSGQAIDVWMAHGDFAAWNTRCCGNGLFVFDWEYAREEATPGWDLFHFHLAHWAALGKRLTAHRLRGLLDVADAWAIPDPKTMLQACALDIALFYRDMIARDGRPSDRMITMAEDAMALLADA